MYISNTILITILAMGLETDGKVGDAMPSISNVTTMSLMNPNEKTILVQLQPKLRPKPGYIIGRIIDMKGRPLTQIDIQVEGFFEGVPIEQAAKFSPVIDPRTGYYEIKVPGGHYRVDAAFSEKIVRDINNIACLLVLEHDFVTGDGHSFNQQPYSDSRPGIIRDFVWNPDPYWVKQCPLFR